MSEPKLWEHLIGVDSIISVESSCHLSLRCESHLVTYVTAHLLPLNQNNERRGLSSLLPLLKCRCALRNANVPPILGAFIKHLQRQRRRYSTLPKFALPNGVSARGDDHAVMMCHVITRRLFGLLCHVRLPGNKSGREGG